MTSGMSSSGLSGFSGATPVTGTPVFTSDGDELGKVKETSGGCFKVDVTMQPDFWLGMDAVSEVTTSRVLLSIPKDRVGDFKLEGPEHSGVHHHEA
jgi:hypothetical protein